jgi:hypothetical protein
MQFQLSSDRGQAVETFRRLHGQARRHQFWARLTGHRAGLSCLHDTLGGHRPRPQRPVGIQLVPLVQIRGSEGRCTEFDEAFRPLQQYTAERWINLAMAYDRAAPLPPVELIKVGDLYYVRDGHHRISVARSMGWQEIEAEVTEWEA